ncbi:tetratricopeptide repeat protein [Ancylostoma duodenale]|uniref:Tetratricopeptide repeat protein n=1 Tax=Ancylostoma duodenale TaxID=51022 RepID=A0A0C2DJ80_9BILA|nr:tetratricopeptide repeat protein [Ancylostoma duodenale]
MKALVLWDFMFSTASVPSLNSIGPTSVDVVDEEEHLDFNNYYSNGDPRRCAERSILFKANRVLEARLDYITSRVNTFEAGLYKKQLFEVYKKLGHVAVLAQDWVKALSAYQEAYRLQPLEYWEDPGAYYGLGLVYIHFKEFKLAADSFSRLLYSFPNLDIIVEVKARLGVCYQNLGDYPRALKFYNQALSDSSETPFLSKTHIRFNIALSSENAGDLPKAEEEYKNILAEASPLYHFWEFTAHLPFKQQH